MWRYSFMILNINIISLTCYLSKNMSNQITKIFIIGFIATSQIADRNSSRQLYSGGDWAFHQTHLHGWLLLLVRAYHPFALCIIKKLKQLIHGLEIGKSDWNEVTVEANDDSNDGLTMKNAKKSCFFFIIIIMSQSQK
ncbi:hypothetical protein L6452_31358 [Arctium lappa]|uniref:Uncharacterized protein n=1 Tax=Arctium lappa TaxID=4217 RepID=A0ACB8ZQ40_ARCLA|nr:hypothetical protein L6452_31358 [Arctium lappa]